MSNRFIVTKSIPHPTIKGKIIPIRGHWIGPGRKLSTLTPKHEFHLRATRRKDGRLKHATYPQWDRELDKVNNASVADRKRQRLMRRIGL